TQRGKRSRPSLMAVAGRASCAQPYRGGWGDREDGRLSLALPFYERPHSPGRARLGAAGSTFCSAAAALLDRDDPRQRPVVRRGAIEGIVAACGVIGDGNVELVQSRTHERRGNRGLGAAQKTGGCVRQRSGLG